MNKKVVMEAIEKMDYYDLKKFEKELDNGNFRRLIAEKVMKHEEGKKICVTCGRSLDGRKFSLTFEQEGMKKTAEFCALDCLEYFLGRVKKVIKV